MDEAGSEDQGTEPPKRRSWTRRLVVVGALIVAIVFLGYVGLSFIGAQVGEVLRGTIEFGTGGSGCTVEGRASKFISGSGIYVVAYPSRDVAAGEVLTFRVVHDGVEEGRAPRTQDSALGRGDCLAGTFPATAFAPGHYRFEYLAGTETLAQGEFDIAP